MVYLIKQFFSPFISLSLVISDSWPHYCVMLLWMAYYGYPENSRQPSGENNMSKEKKSNKENKKKAVLSPKEKKAAKKHKKEATGLFANDI